jgi:hypothetical protein
MKDSKLWVWPLIGGCILLLVNVVYNTITSTKFTKLDIISPVGFAILMFYGPFIRKKE